ncbi:hypothetical protein A2U01_0038771, partial [Trifolium medium]|nr:hypothetical protein [Trifolium medium]
PSDSKVSSLNHVGEEVVGSGLLPASSDSAIDENAGDLSLDEESLNTPPPFEIFFGSELMEKPGVVLAKNIEDVFYSNVKHGDGSVETGVRL